MAPKPKFITFALSVIQSTAAADKPKPLEQVNPDVFLFDNDAGV